LNFFLDIWVSLLYNRGVMKKRPTPQTEEDGMSEAAKEIAEAIRMGEMGRAANVVSAGESPEERAELRRVYEAEKAANEARYAEQRRRQKAAWAPARKIAMAAGAARGKDAAEA
jgi:hypothetical protein